MPHGIHHSRILQLVRKATVAFRVNDWALNQVDPDGLRYVATISVRAHWFVIAVLFFELVYRPYLHFGGKVSKPFDDELDRHIQMGMFALDRISTDGTMHKVASATSYVLDGKCIRIAKIDHCREIEPMSSGLRVVRADGSEVRRVPWSCVPGTPPTSHSNLMGCDTVT